LDVHHIRRFGDYDSYKEANRLENLICYCHSCHMFVEWKGHRSEVRTLKD
jgi:predicted HNH restriction endonuclease